MQPDYCVIALLALLAAELALGLVDGRELWLQDDRLGQNQHALGTGFMGLAGSLLLRWLPGRQMLELFMLAFKQAFERVLQIEE